MKNFFFFREKIIDVFKGEKDDSMENLIFDVWIQQPNMKWTEEHQSNLSLNSNFFTKYHVYI